MYNGLLYGAYVQQSIPSFQTIHALLRWTPNPPGFLGALLPATQRPEKTEKIGPPSVVAGIRRKAES